MSDPKPIIPLSANEAWERRSDVPYSRDTRDEYRDHQNWLRKCHEQYATSLTAEQAVLVYEQAWEDGHHNGYHEVEGCYSTLVDLVEKVIAL